MGFIRPRIVLCAANRPCHVSGSEDDVSLVDWLVSLPDIDRLENADYEEHSLPMIRKIAAVFGTRIELNFVPITKENNKRRKS